MALINGATKAWEYERVSTQPQVSGNQVSDEVMEGDIGEIPQIYLGSTVTSFLSNIDPFYVTLIVDGKLLNNCMIDLGASSNIMQIEIMKKMGLKINCAYGKCYVIDLREIPVIGVIKDVPYRLVVFPNKDFFMSIVVVDIPPNYSMLLSRKWSASMGGSMQCDMFFATFPIEGKDTNLVREPRAPHMIEFVEQAYRIHFVDTGRDNFMIEDLREEEKQPTPIEKEVLQQANNDNLWNMHSDGACLKEGVGAGVILISPSGKTFKFSFSLFFACTNNVAEYEALLLGLSLSKKHGIKNLRVIRDSKLVVS